jgi:AcrR family transcriptional regulator
MPTGAGLRERKKQRTREAIAGAAMRLFAERGYEHTTIADIAEAADIAPRTFFAYFPSKEDVVFSDFAEIYDGFVARIDGRRAGETAIDAMRTWITDLLPRLEAGEERFAARRALVRRHDALAARDRHHSAQIQRVLARGVAEDLGDAPDGLRPRMVAAAAFAALDSLEESAEGTDADPLTVLDEALAFLRGGIAALRSR